MGRGPQNLEALYSFSMLCGFSHLDWDRSPPSSNRISSNCHNQSIGYLNDHSVAKYFAVFLAKQYMNVIKLRTLGLVTQNLNILIIITD